MAKYKIINLCWGYYYCLQTSEVIGKYGIKYKSYYYIEDNPNKRFVEVPDGIIFFTVFNI